MSCLCRGRLGLFPANRVKDFLCCGDVLGHFGQVHLVCFERAQLFDRVRKLYTFDGGEFVESEVKCATRRGPGNLELSVFGLDRSLTTFSTKIINWKLGI